MRYFNIQILHVSWDNRNKWSRLVIIRERFCTPFWNTLGPSSFYMCLGRLPNHWRFGEVRTRADSATKFVGKITGIPLSADAVDKFSEKFELYTFWTMALVLFGIEAGATWKGGLRVEVPENSLEISSIFSLAHKLIWPSDGGAEKNFYRNSSEWWSV